MHQSDAQDLTAPWLPLHYLPQGATSVLDVGCNAGKLLLGAHKLGARQLNGVDINPHAVEKATRNLAAIPGSKVVHACADTLPFETASMDVVFCTEVLEHVPEEYRPQLIREVHRVLRKNGSFVITVPHAGLFAFLDPANSRLRFPKLFGAAASALRGIGREVGYQGQEHGIVWHHHFTRAELESLLGPLFRVRSVRHRGCLMEPVSGWLTWPFHRHEAWGNPLYRALSWMGKKDMSIPFPERLAYNVLLVAERVEARS